MRVTVATSAGTSSLEGSDILVATGRIPNTQDVGLDKTGVPLDALGYFQVNERLETTAPGVWALGECAGSPQFTHVSEDDFRIVHPNLPPGDLETRMNASCRSVCSPIRKLRESESQTFHLLTKPDNLTLSTRGERHGKKTECTGCRQQNAGV